LKVYADFLDDGDLSTFGFNETGDFFLIVEGEVVCMWWRERGFDFFIDYY